MAGTVEQAAVNALAAWLTVALPDVTIRRRWPDDDKALPERAITILLTGKADDEWTTPRHASHKTIHADMPAELVLDTTAIVDTATAVVALNAVRADYVIHLADTAAHAAADVTNGPTVAAASDLATGIALANNLRTKLTAHLAAAGASAPHPAEDTLNAPTAPIATNEPTLVALAKNLVDCLRAHYAARVYLWMLGARVQPVQLDIWSCFEATRDEMIGAVEQKIRQGSVRPDGPDIYSDYAPVGLGIAVTLGSDWPDASAAFDFESPTRSQDPQAQEWRATYEGIVDVPMLVWAQSARLARSRFTSTIDNADRTVDVDWADNSDGYTETLAG